MAKRALLVGCNYPGTNAALNGCINDVWGTHAMLKTYFGFTDQDITVMIDTDKNYTQPTGKNIKATLSQMVTDSQDGDLLVFHFSGHGTQIPSDADEVDGKDEAICPSDMNVITDDDLRAIFGPLSQKPGVKLTFIADCCHSGTLLDHNEVIISGPKAGGPPPPTIDVQAIQGMLAALGADGGKRDFKNRALPFNDLTSLLSSLLGQPVGQGNVRSSMATLFGADASAKVQNFMQYVNMAQKAMAAFQGNGTKQEGGGGGGGVLEACLGICFGGGGNQAVNEGTTPAPGHAAGTPPAPGSKPPNKLSDDVGILITGCQDKETSADACPSGDKTKAHGALSNALHTVVKQHFAQNPGQPLTYRNLVIAVREALAKSGFTQNPCLECDDKFADCAFVTVQPVA